MIPTFRATLEEAVWAAAYVRYLTSGSDNAWRLADSVVEQFRDEAQRRAIEKGPDHG